MTVSKDTAKGNALGHPSRRTLLLKSAVADLSKYADLGNTRDQTLLKDERKMDDGMQEKSHQSDETAIRKLVETWMAASKAGDIATVLDLMTEDVIFMVPGREPFGKEAFAGASDAMKNVRMEGKSDIRELRVLGDWAYLRNYIVMTITPEGGVPVKRSGYTLTILRKEDGRWRLARDANLVM